MKKKEKHFHLLSPQNVNDFKNIFIEINDISIFFHFFKELKVKELIFRGGPNCYIFDEQKIIIIDYAYDYKTNIETIIKILVPTYTSDCNNHSEPK